MRFVVDAPTAPSEDPDGWLTTPGTASRATGTARGPLLWGLERKQLALLAGIVLPGIACGYAIAVAGLNGLYLCISVIGCAVILFDFRVGVVLLILLMPLSGSRIFPHAMLGITGLNPMNLLLVGTLGSYLLQAVSDGSIRRFLPPALWWLYILPVLLAGAIGLRHVDEIPPGFALFRLIEFNDAAGYLRDLVLKPLLMVVFALTVAAAVAKSEKPERFLIPTLMSIWLMGLLVIAFVLRSGAGLSQLASSTAREFLSSLGLHANDLGRLYAVAYALLLFTWAATDGMRLRLALAASMGMIAVALMLTFSRGAFVAFIVVNVLFLMWQRSAKAFTVLGLLAATAVLALPNAVYDRVTAGFGMGANEISAGRLEGIWLPQVPEILRSPIFGNGTGSILWSRAMREGDGVLHPAVTHPHNAYLQALQDMGMIGMTLVCAYFFHVWRGFRAASRDPTLGGTLRGFFQGAAAGLASLLVSGVTDGSLVPRPEQAFLWLAIGIMYGQRAKRQAT
jgi:hypothetical protein